jgi:hypothetical protein
MIINQEHPYRLLCVLVHPDSFDAVPLPDTLAAGAANLSGPWACLTCPNVLSLRA